MIANLHSGNIEFVKDDRQISSTSVLTTGSAFGPARCAFSLSIEKIKTESSLRARSNDNFVIPYSTDFTAFRSFEFDYGNTGFPHCRSDKSSMKTGWIP